AVGVPASAGVWIRGRTRSLAEHLAARAELDARIGGVDADLTGAIRMAGVAAGDVFAAEQIEAPVRYVSLHGGRLAVVQIPVASPRLAIEVERDGDSDLARLARRLARSDRGAAPAVHATTRTRLRRIAVSSGTLTARIAGVGELSADD